MDMKRAKFRFWLDKMSGERKKSVRRRSKHQPSCDLPPKSIRDSENYQMLKALHSSLESLNTSKSFRSKDRLRGTTMVNASRAQSMECMTETSRVDAAPPAHTSVSYYHERQSSPRVLVTPMCTPNHTTRDNHNHVPREYDKVSSVEDLSWLQSVNCNNNAGGMRSVVDLSLSEDFSMFKPKMNRNQLRRSMRNETSLDDDRSLHSPRAPVPEPPQGCRAFFRKFQKLAPFPERIAPNTPMNEVFGFDVVTKKKQLPALREPVYKIDSRQKTDENHSSDSTNSLPAFSLKAEVTKINLGETCTPKEQPRFSCKPPKRTIVPLPSNASGRLQLQRNNTPEDENELIVLNQHF